MFGNTGTGYRSWGPTQKSTGELLAEGGVRGQDQTSSAEKEQQANALSEIVQLLLSAGYFRARIASLSEFDKVVGGLCWCITSSGVGVDVDILFTENSTIGERVKLSEKIIHVLRHMGCQHPLQANQIQGSDWVNVQPVIVWLIKKFFENRELTQRQLRMFATLQFGKHYAIPSEVEVEPQGVADVMSKYGVERRYRLKEGMGGMRKNTEESRVHAVLLEYGETLKARYGLEGSEGEAQAATAGAASAPPSAGTAALFQKGGDELSAFERKLAKVQQQAVAAEQELAKEIAQEEGVIMEGMQSLDGQGLAAASAKQVGSIVGLGTEEIASAAARYEESIEEARKKLEESAAAAAGGGAASFGKVAAYKRQKAALERQTQELEPKLQGASQVASERREKLASVSKALDERKATSEKLQAKIQALQAKESTSDMKGELDKLKSLVMLNEQLKSQEAAFKANCKRQLATLRQSIQAQSGAEDTDEMARVKEIESMHSQVMGKYDRLRQLVAERNLTIASNMRLIDDVPTRTELIQYERRFTELYQQVAVKLGENKKYFEMYNTLEETLKMLQKEVNLINSISDNFAQAMQSKDSKDMFLTQFQSIIKGIDDSLQRQNSTLQERTARLDALTTKNHQLVEEQRRYLKAVRDFQEECDKNEILSSRLATTSP